MAIYEDVGELVVVRCWCGVQHAVPASLRSLQQRQHLDARPQQEIYCPLGHTHVIAGEGKAAKLERELQRERARHDQTKAERDAAERSRRAIKGAHTRTKNRVAKGICPCCNRHFANLQRHMENQHPDYLEMKEG